MLIKPPLEKLLLKVENRYTLATLAAKRTRQLVDGGQPMIESESPNLVTLSCEEIASGSVVGVAGQYEPEVPLRPEIEAEILAREQEAKEQAALEAFAEANNEAPKPEPPKEKKEAHITLSDVLIANLSDLNSAVEAAGESEDEIIDSDEEEITLDSEGASEDEEKTLDSEGASEDEEKTLDTEEASDDEEKTLDTEESVEEVSEKEIESESDSTEE